MKHYEVIQKMNKKEMAAVFFMFLKPFLSDVEYSKDEIAAIIKDIENTLDQEVSPNGFTTSEK